MPATTLPASLIGSWLKTTGAVKIEKKSIPPSQHTMQSR